MMTDGVVAVAVAVVVALVLLLIEQGKTRQNETIQQGTISQFEFYLYHKNHSVL